LQKKILSGVRPKGDYCKEKKYKKAMRAKGEILAFRGKWEGGPKRTNSFGQKDRNCEMFGRDCEAKGGRKKKGLVRPKKGAVKK